MAPGLSEPGRGQFWERYDAIEARLSGPLSERMVELAGLVPGQRVLDVGAGRGEPSIRAARRVAPGGSVLGIDVAEPLLQLGRIRAVREGVTNLELRVGDAETIDAGTFDAVTSRWVLMYLQRPLEALARVKASLKPGGVFVAALWAEPERVPYFTLPRAVLAPYRAVPPIDPEAPGPFRFGSVDRIERDFSRAGLRIEHVEEVEVPVMEGTPADLLGWVRAMGLTRLLSALPEDVQQRWEADFLRTVEGVPTLGGITRVVVAR